LIGLLLGVAVALGAIGQWAWQRSMQAAREDAAQAEVSALRAELEQTNGRLATLEGHLAALEAADIAAQLAKVEAGLGELAGDVDELAKAVQALRSSGQAGGETLASLPPEVHLTVARQSQGHSLSCESSAASMAAQYQGVSLSEADVLAALPRSDNPHLGFRGNVDGPTGGLEDYGVYAEPIAAVLDSRGLRASLVQGGLDGIRAALARGNPVIAWVTYNTIASTPVTVSIGGEPVVLVPWQHAVVVTGYSPEGVWANDPYNGQEDFYARADFERALAYFGDMAIEVAKP
jgi:uncharacterized protein YvpB